MKIFIVIFYVVVILSYAKCSSVFTRTFDNLHQDPEAETSARTSVQTKWISQKLDHFNDSDTRTWKMRYLLNDEFYETGSPLFIFVGGEWSIGPGSISKGLFYDMAAEHKGYLFYTEHRYYGESQPLSDLSQDNLEYLHIRQSLADLAHFIQVMKATIPGLADSKVILSGCSYSATMVTWFKKLYPQLAAGCWASSAPLLGKMDFVEYKEVVGESIKFLGGSSCYERLQQSVQELEAMLSNNRSTEVRSLLKICDNFEADNDMDVWSLFSQISDIFAGVVQNHNNDTIQNACRDIMAGEHSVSGLLKFLSKYLNSKSCNDFSYKSQLEFLNYTTSSKGMYRQWIYQTCNEYGWYQTSGSFKQPFGSNFPVEFYTRLCYDLFGEKFTQNYIEQQIQKTNEFFGALDLQVENVYMTHGQLDPWRSVGIQDEDRATIIPLRAHCKDRNSISEDDTPELRASKEKLAELVREWLK